MANAVSALHKHSHKTPIVVVLADSVVSLDSSQRNAAITYYLNPLLRRLSKLRYRRRPIHVGFVTYGLLHASGNPIEVTGFSPLDAQFKLKEIPAGQTIEGDPLCSLALDGYAEALKLIDGFKSGSGQSSEEEFSYHLWHIATGQHDGSETTHCDSSPTLLDVRWETLPNEIKTRDINFSMILLNPCPKFSDVFYRTSPTPIDPWFGTCPHHTILLSGFASSPDRGGKTSLTILIKRAAEDVAEEGFPRRRTRRAFSDPTPGPALPRVKAHDQSVDPWSATLIWPRENSPDVCLKVLATSIVRHIDTATLPMSLRVEILGDGVQTRDIQGYIRKKRASMMRITYACETNANDVGTLITSLRSRKSFAIARCEAQGKDSSLSSLLLAPLGESLFCAILPTSDPQDLPKAQPAKPLPEKKGPQLDCPPSVETSPVKLENTDCPQGDPVCAQPAALVMPTVTLDYSQIVVPQQHPSLHPTSAFSTATQDLPQMPPQQYQIIEQQQHSPPCYLQTLFSHPQDQQCQQYISSDMPPALQDGVDTYRSVFIGPLPKNEACVVYDHTYADPYAMDTNQGLYVGNMNEVGTCLVRPGQANVLEAQQLMFQQFQDGLGYSSYNQ